MIVLYCLVALATCSQFVTAFTVRPMRPAATRKAVTVKPTTARWALPELLELSQTAANLPLTAGDNAMGLNMLPIVAGAAVALVLGGTAFVAASKLANDSPDGFDTKSSPPEPVKIDVSIPYDAPAMLAYREKLGLTETDAIDREEFNRFKGVYEEAAIAEVIVKKKQRELEQVQELAKAKAAKLDSLVAK